MAIVIIPFHSNTSRPSTVIINSILVQICDHTFVLEALNDTRCKDKVNWYIRERGYQLFLNLLFLNVVIFIAETTLSLLLNMKRSHNRLLSVVWIQTDRQ